MLKIKNKILFLTILVIFFICLNTISASENTVLYLTNDKIKDSTLKRTINTIYIASDDEHSLYVNETKMGESSISSNKLNYVFTINLLKIELSLNLENNQASFKYIDLSSKSIDGWLYLKTIEGVDTIYVYPNISDINTVYVLEGTNKGDFVEFDNLSYTYQDLKINLSIYIDVNNNKLVLNDGDSIRYVNIDRSIQSQYVFLETLVNQHTLDSEYLTLLEKKNFMDAKNTMYLHDDISNAVFNEKITLKNTKSGLTYTTGISQFVGYWKRIGLEDYDTNYDEIMQVVCQYGEDACAAINSKNQTFTIFAENFYIEKPYTYTLTITEKDYSDLVWSEWYTHEDFKKLKKEMVQKQSQTMYTYAYLSDWSKYKYSQEEVKNTLTTKSTIQYRYKKAEYTDYTDYIYDESIKQQCDGYNKKYIQKKFYAKSTATWGAYSSYNNLTNNYCIISGNCRSLSKKFYAYQTGTWSPYSSYVYSISSPELSACINDEDCAYTSTTMYALVEASYTGKYDPWQKTCTASGDYKCQDYYKYTCRAGLFTKTVYSTVKYNKKSRGPCSSGYVVSKIKEGYRKAYVEFKQPTFYNLTSCSSNSNYNKCFSTKMYALKYRTWSNYTDYDYDSCTNVLNSYGESIRCKSITKYAYSFKKYSDYSDYIYESCVEDDLTKCKSIIKYATADLKWGDYGQWQDSKVVSDKYTIVETRYRYQTRNISDSYLGLSVPNGAIKLSEDIYFRYSYPKTKTSEKEYLSYISEPIGLIENVDANYIRTLASNIASDKAKVKIIKNAGGTISKDEYDNKVNDVNLFDTQEYLRVLNEKMYVSDVYILRHYRATKRNISVNTKNVSYKLYTSNNKQLYKECLEQFSVYYPDKDNVKVVYFDKDDPLGKYTEMPTNWLGYNELIYQIKNIDDGDGEIIIHLSSDDVKNIREYINTKGSDGLLKEFKHIFKRINKSLEEYLRE